MAESYLYEVRRGDQVLMRTLDPKCGYAPDVEICIQQSGCDIYINGKKRTLLKQSKRKATPKTERER